MKNLCLVSYYGPIETIALASAKLGEYVKVYDFPLFAYMYDEFDKIDNYIELFAKFIVENEINYVLFWYINIGTDDFIEIKKRTNVKYLFFNWDEPFNWGIYDIENKMPYFDAVFVTCMETLGVYINNGCKEAHCLYPAFDSSVNYMIDVNEYICDISICCTNLYGNEELYPNQYVNRKKLIGDIYDGQFVYGYKFNIYGPKYLKGLYPLSYVNSAKYDELNYIFNYSKINLCTHVMCNKGGYLNERVILVGGSCGLLLVDYVKDIENVFDVDNEIIILERDDYVGQIVGIINEYDKYICRKYNMNKKCLELFTYEKWAECIMNVVDNL